MACLLLLVQDTKISSLERNIRDLEDEVQMLKTSNLLHSDDKQEELKQVEVYKSHSKFMKTKVECLHAAKMTLQCMTWTMHVLTSNISNYVRTWMCMLHVGTRSLVWIPGTSRIINVFIISDLDRVHLSVFSCIFNEIPVFPAYLTCVLTSHCASCLSLIFRGTQLQPYQLTAHSFSLLSYL